MKISLFSLDLDSGEYILFNLKFVVVIPQFEVFFIVDVVDIFQVYYNFLVLGI